MARRRRLPQRIVRALLKTLVAFVALSAAAVAALRWIDPPGSAVMAWHVLAALRAGHDRPYLYHEWVPWTRISPALPLAVVAGEDQRFPHHRGFDLVELGNAWRDYRQNGRLRGASTLSQQVAKNLFLWHGRSLLRKGLEAWFTLLVESLWPKRRILEVYLNIAQFGPETYGVGAASWRLFERPPAAIDAEQAALMAAVLPNPEVYRAESPSPYVRERAAWIRGQMRQLGADYLRGL